MKIDSRRIEFPFSREKRKMRFNVPATCSKRIKRSPRSVSILAYGNNADQSLPCCLVRLGWIFAKEIYPFAMDAFQPLERERI